MATLNLQSFDALVANQVAAIQSRATALTDFAIGSVLRSIVEAKSGVALWLQSQILQVLAVARAATSTGSDLDSFVNDFNLARFLGTASIGQVTFSRFTNVASALVPVGALVQTLDGTQNFIVVADPTNPAYSASQGGYPIAAGVSSVTATVNSVTAASAANVAAGTISVIQSSIPGVDYCNNAAATSAGTDAETDSALRVRFRAYILSLSRATLGAISYAIIGTQAGLSYSIVENIDYATQTTRLGYFYVIVDDGSGSPPTSLLNSVLMAVDSVRAAGVQFAVFPPSLVYASVSATIVTSSSYDHGLCVAAATTAVTTFLNSLADGAGLSYTDLYAAIYNASSGITNVSNLLLNGAIADMTITPRQVIKAGTISIS